MAYRGQMEVRIKIETSASFCVFFPTILRLRVLGLLCVCEVQTREIESVVFSSAPHQSLRAIGEDAYFLKSVGQGSLKSRVSTSTDFFLLFLSLSSLTTWRNM